jgi:hypothetical protein
VLQLSNAMHRPGARIEQDDKKLVLSAFISSFGISI